MLRNTIFVFYQSSAYFYARLIKVFYKKILIGYCPKKVIQIK
jgi:hypothetical protein